MEKVGFAGVLGRAIRLAILIAVLVPTSASAGIRATVVGTFNAPTYVAAPPGDTHRLFVVEQGGEIEMIKDGGTPTTFLNISSEVTFVGGEQGLLSMAFSPDYSASGRFYVYYTSKNCQHSPGCDEHVSEFTASPGADTANAGTEHVLITIPHPSQSNHNGGQLQFGPDGDLYVSVGDGGGGNDTEMNAQHKTTLLGKILRISPQPGGTYTIPPGNPFSGGTECSSGPSASTDCPEIWAYGLRNPWRFSFDRVTDDLWIGDVGQDAWEEIDHVPATSGRDAGKGDNFGWSRLEGNHPYRGRVPAHAVPPVYEISHDTGACAVIGGFVYRGRAIRGLAGKYLFSDNCDGTIRVLSPKGNGGVTETAAGVEASSVSSFGQANDGTLYVLSLSDGIYRVAP